MGETTFRATFSADDQSLSSSMRKMREESHLMANDMIADANKIAKATDQNVNKVLQEQINLYEKGRKATMHQERMSLDSSWSAKLQAASPQNQSGIKAQWDIAKKDLSEQFKRDDIQIDLLRDIVGAINGSAMHGMGSKQSKDNIGRVRSGKTDEMSAESEYRARVQYGMSSKENEGGMRNMWEVAKGTMLGGAIISTLGKIGSSITGAMTDTDGSIGAARLLAAVPFAGGTLESFAARHMELAERGDRSAMGINSRAGRMVANILQDTDKFDLTAAISKGRNIDGSVTTDKDDQNSLEGLADINMIMHPNMKRGYAEQEAKKQMIQMKADADSEMAKREDDKMSWSYEEAGVSRDQFLEMASSVQSGIGSSNNLKSQTRSFIDLTRGGGFSDSTVGGVMDLIRLSGGGSLGSIMGGMVGGLGEGGALRDRHMADVVSLASGRFSDGFGTVDLGVMSRLKGAFRNNFGEALSSSDNIGSMMSSMSKPSDEFQQGINYKIYAEQMAKAGKEATYVGFKQWQEKPENGLLSGKMDYIKSVYGTGEFGVMAANAAGIGKTWEANELYIKGGTKGLSSEELHAKNNVVGYDASKYTTHRQQQQAELTDAITVGMFKGMAKSLEQISSAIGGNGVISTTLNKILKQLSD